MSAGPVLACRAPACGSIVAPRITREVWDAFDRVVVSSSLCDTCGTVYMTTRPLTAREAGAAQAHHATIRAAAPRLFE